MHAMFRSLRRPALAAAALVSFAAPGDAAELPLTGVVLSTAGLAQFTHAGPATAGDTIDLQVRFDQVDDILKSLTVFDALGAAGTMSLPGRQPLEELFRDLPFDRSALDSPTTLLSALAGSEIEITGPVNARGRVFAIEPEEVVVDDGHKKLTRHRLSLLTDKGLVQAVYEDIATLTFLEPQTRAQIDRAMAGVIDNRAKDRRRISLSVMGQGTRDIAVSYVVAAPIWKTSWRLVLPKDGDKARLQGWAVLENLTGGDWKNVELTLVSGNPVALSQQLYTAFYATREDVPVAGGGVPLPSADEASAAKTVMRGGADQLASGKLAAMPPPPPAPAMAASVPVQAEAPAPMPQMANAEAATAEDAATQLLYRFPGRVSLATGATMMVPFVDREIAAERIWLYRPDSNARRPLAAVRLRNDGETGLPTGIVTAYETGGDGATRFVGDSVLPLLPRGETKFVSFALDSKTDIRREDKGVRRTTLGTAVDGRLTLTVGSRHTIAYEVTPPADEDRDIVVEEERPDGWTPAGDTRKLELTPTRLRFTIAAPKGAVAHADLVLERTDTQVLLLTSLPAENILAQVKGLENEGPVLKDAIDRLSEIVGNIVKAQSQRAQLDAERKKITEDQDRVRRNLQATGANSDLGRRYIDTLRTEEDRLGEIGRADQKLVEAIEGYRRAAEDAARKLKL